MSKKFGGAKLDRLREKSGMARNLPDIARAHQTRDGGADSRRIEPICLPDSRVSDQGQVISLRSVRMMRLSDNGDVVVTPCSSRAE